jgi:hypothetical protein
VRLEWLGKLKKFIHHIGSKSSHIFTHTMAAKHHSTMWNWLLICMQNCSFAKLYLIRWFHELIANTERNNNEVYMSKIFLCPQMTFCRPLVTKSFAVAEFMSEPTHCALMFHDLKEHRLEVSAWVMVLYKYTACQKYSRLPSSGHHYFCFTSRHQGSSCLSLRSRRPEAHGSCRVLLPQAI